MSVVVALLRKEVRQLLPVIVGLGALVLWAQADSFILKAGDAHSWAAGSWLMNHDVGKSEAIGTLIVGVLIAYTLLAGEHEQRTIEFLYTLPVRRRTVFLVKYTLGCALLVASSLAGTAILLLQHALHPGSFERALAPRIILLSLAGDVVPSLVAVAYGMLLSFFRRLGWMLFALIWIGLEVTERAYPPLRILNVKVMSVVEHHGTEPLVNWWAWLLHGAMAAAALLLAGRLWLARQESFAVFYDKLRVNRKLLGTGTAVGLGVAALAMAGMMAGLYKPTDGPADQTAERVVSFETERFHFTYRQSLSAQALIVTRAADEAYGRVRQALGAPDVERIVADLTDESDEHLGVAGWKKLRMDLRPPKSVSLLTHVLYHETAHVFAAAMSEGVPRARQAELRFFSEGLAEYVAYELLPNLRAERDEARRIAGLAHRQFRLQFDDLLVPEVFLQRHDEYLMYALGEVWITALVDTCGANAPGRLLRAFAAAKTPQTLAGLDLWRHALQMDRCDLDRVLGAFEQRLRRMEREASAVPVATGNLVAEEEDTLVFEVAVKSPIPGSFPVSVRVRADANTPESDVSVANAVVSAGASQRVSVPAPDYLGRRIEFQVGARTQPGHPAFYTRWQSATRP